MTREELIASQVHCGSCGRTLPGSSLVVWGRDVHRGSGTQRGVLDPIFSGYRDWDLDQVRCLCGSRFGAGALVG